MFSRLVLAKTAKKISSRKQHLQKLPKTEVLINGWFLKTLGHFTKKR